MSRVTVVPFDGPLGQLEPLVARWPYKPLQWVDGSPDALQRLVLGRIDEKLRCRDAKAWVASRDGIASGILMLQELPWDSRILGMRAGRFEYLGADTAAENRDLLDALLEVSLIEARHRQIQHIIIRVDAGEDAAIHALERRGFLNVDTLVTFGATVSDVPATVPAQGVFMRLASAVDAASVGDIAEAAFVQGRFHSDPSVTPDRARRVYRTWAEESCNGTAADAVLIAANAEGTAGFVACRLQRDTAVHLHRSTGTITLIASHGAVRGRGVGTSLVAAAVDWFRENGAVAVEVGTQLRNVAAARLYERCGFRLVSGAVSFRLMIGS